MTADDYVSRVAFELRDLPWGVRRDLVSGLRGHLDELPEGTYLEERLGTPEEYAADLRAAAGLERRRGVVAFLLARRPRNVVLAAVALTATGLAIGFVVWVQTYQPLSFAGGGLDPARTREAPAQNSESVVFHKGRPFELGTTVENTGSFTVRVLGVADVEGPFTARLLMAQARRDPGVHGPFTRFRPFDLKPGEIRALVLKGVYAGCPSPWAPGTSAILASLPVRFAFLWRTTTTRVPLLQQLAIVVPRRQRCR